MLFENMTPLYLAAQYGHLKCIRLLLKRGAFPSIKVHNITYDTYITAAETAFGNKQYRCYYAIKTANVKEIQFSNISSPLLIIN